MSPDRPTADEIARVRAWEASERQRGGAEERIRHKRIKDENEQRIVGYFAGKRIVGVHLMTEADNRSDDVWDFTLAFEDGSSVSFDVYGSHIELAYKAARSLSVDECPTCEGGLTVRSCPVHGLGGTAPR